MVKQSRSKRKHSEVEESDDNVTLQQILRAIQKVEGRVDKMGEELQGVKGGMEKMEGRMEKMEGRMEKMEGSIKVLIQSSLTGLLKLKTPSVIATRKVEEEAVLKGGIATWTLVKAEHTSGYTYYAIGSKHCALYYATATKGMCFVSLPKEVVKAGVKQFGFQGSLDSEAYEDDVVAVQLAAKPSGYDDSAITTYDTDGPLELSNIDCDVVVGKSHSGQVSGKCLMVHENHYVFVEDQGEPGNSGTLLCAPNSESGELQLLGTYFVTRSEDGQVTSRRSRRPRGVVAPLPKDPEKGFTWFQPINPTSDVKLQLCHSRGIIHCKPAGKGKADSRYYQVKDEGVWWPGILLGETVKYAAFPLTGSARSI